MDNADVPHIPRMPHSSRCHGCSDPTTCREGRGESQNESDQLLRRLHHPETLGRLTLAALIGVVLVAVGWFACTAEYSCPGPFTLACPAPDHDGPAVRHCVRPDDTNVTCSDVVSGGAIGAEFVEMAQRGCQSSEWWEKAFLTSLVVAFASASGWCRSIALSP